MHSITAGDEHIWKFHTSRYRQLSSNDLGVQQGWWCHRSAHYNHRCRCSQAPCTRSTWPCWPYQSCRNLCTSSLSVKLDWPLCAVHRLFMLFNSSRSFNFWRTHAHITPLIDWYHTPRVVLFWLLHHRRKCILIGNQYTNIIILTNFSSFFPNSSPSSSSCFDNNTATLHYPVSYYVCGMLYIYILFLYPLLYQVFGKVAYVIVCFSSSTRL